MTQETQVIAVMGTYIILLIGWGLYQGRKVKTDEDYAIAGRTLPGWAAALSERASGESSWALLGLPGAAYATGLMEIWTAVGCVAGIITSWWVLAWRLRDEAEKYRISSFTEYISKRHGESAKMIRGIASAVIVFFFFFYVAAQFIGGGKTLFTLMKIDPVIGMILSAVVIIPYTVYGGFQSVVYTDVVQAILMILTLVVGPLVGVIYIANHPELFAQSIPQALAKAGPAYESLTHAASGFGTGTIIVAGLSWFFGYLGGQPQLSMRFMAIKDSKNAKQGRNIGIAWTILAYIGALSIGWIGLAIFGPNGLADQEYVMPAVMMKLFPPALAALLITGAIAAMVSTADSLLILSSSELAENIIKPIFKSKNDETPQKALARSRIITTLLAIIALGVALISNLLKFNLIFTIVGYVWAGIGGTFSIVILLTLTWKKYHGRAVIITIITGMLFTILWGVSDMEKLLTSRLLTFFVAGLTAVLATYLVPPKSPGTKNE